MWKYFKKFLIEHNKLLLIEQSSLQFGKLKVWLINGKIIEEQLFVGKTLRNKILKDHVRVNHLHMY